VPALTAKPQPMSANDSLSQNFDENGTNEKRSPEPYTHVQFTPKIEASKAVMDRQPRSFVNCSIFSNIGDIASSESRCQPVGEVGTEVERTAMLRAVMPGNAE
jgi:hypothetical protein